MEMHAGTTFAPAPLRLKTASRAASTGAAPLALWLSATVTPPACALLAAVAIAAHLGTAAAAAWAATFVALAVVVPTLFIVHEHRAGRLTDLHMNVRAERTRPLAVAMAATAVALAALWTGGAPEWLQALAVVQMAQTILFFAVTLRWKISAHCAGTTGLAVLCCWLFGAAAAPLLLLVPAMIWARVVLHRHTLAQAVAGTLTGVALWLPALSALPVP